MIPSQAAESYRANFPVKPMQRSPENADEVRQMAAVDGMSELPSSPAPVEAFVRHGSLPNARANASEARHLWVIRSQDFPVALEECAWGKALQSGKIKHSNLTGGNPAHSGGEIWFIGDDRVALNASSGRYGAKNQQEFDQIVDALRCAGYYVASMGFDIDNPAVPNAVFVGEPLWQSPI
jgi:hypothetical protein